MYLGVDIGGTKTLVCVFTNDAEIVESIKFPTPKNYDHFILELAHAIHHLEHKEFKAAGVAAPGHIDRKHGRVIDLSNLPWKNVPLQADLEKITKCPVVVENDANLAGLSESLLHKDKEVVLYVTVSTGIGTAVMFNGQLDPGMLDTEGGHLLLPYKDRLTPWEKFASGKAIYRHFGKRASDIHDEADWKHIVRNLALGFHELIAVVGPDLIIVGGSIGTYFDRYGKLLQTELDKHAMPTLTIPRVIGAQRAELAVAYGCFDIAKQTFSHD